MELLHFNSENEDINPYLNWWILATQREPHMVSLDQSFKSDLLHAVIALHKGRPVGAAAIVPARTATHELISFRLKMVVELGSNFVEPDFRRNGLARIFVEERIRIAREKGWFPVSVTTNSAVQDLFMKIGGRPMDNQEELSELRKQLCMCPKGPCVCNFCPFEEKAAWYFPENTTG